MVKEHSEPQRQLGPYQLRGVAGRGGMATVYEATDARDGRRVAVKVLAYVSEQSPEERNKQATRLRREALAISRIKHPHIVEMFDVEISTDNPRAAHYLVMEYVEGETLKNRLYRYGPLPPETAIIILEQIASALDAVHSAEIVHRDIKPSNIMLLPSGAAKLMDFGVARLQDDTMVTRTGMVIGSPAYMSPEQATSQPVGPASDLWSLTAVFYEALTGQPAFRGDSIPAVLYQVAYGEAAPLPAQRDAEMHSVFERFQPVFTRAFQRNPSDRFSSAGELAAAFRAALEGKEAEPATIDAPVLHTRDNETETADSSTRASARITRWAPAILIPVFVSVFALNTWWAARARNIPRPAPTPRNTSPGSNEAVTPIPVTSTVVPAPVPSASATPTAAPTVAPIIREATPTQPKKPAPRVVTKPSARPKAKRTSKGTPRKRYRRTTRRSSYNPPRKRQVRKTSPRPPQKTVPRKNAPRLYSGKVVLPPGG